MTALPTPLFELAQALLPATLLHALEQPEDAPTAVAEAHQALATVLSNLVPFAPPSVVEQILSSTQHARHSGNYVRGSIIVIKLVGYNELLNRLTDRKRQGSEITTARINHVIGELLEEIVPRGGELLKFSGDSLIAFFDRAHLNMQHAPLAAAAALAVQQRISATRASANKHDLPQLVLRLAVHSGSFFVTEVGNHDHKEFLLTGRAAGRAVTACDSAPVGEVVVSDETVRLLKVPKSVPRLLGWHLLESFSFQPQGQIRAYAWQFPQADAAGVQQLLTQISALQPFVPYGLPQRFLQFGNSFGEFRPVVVVVASFYTFKRLLDFLEMAATVEQDITIVGQLIDTYYTDIQTLAHSYGGNVSGMELSAAGDRMLMLFGAPKAHEDDPCRAIDMALELRNVADTINNHVTERLEAWTDTHPDQRSLLRLTRSSHRQRIGIARGTVFAGLLGTASRHEYTVIGEPIGLAGQLMTTAQEGEVIVSAATYRAVQAQLVAEALAPVTFKDFSAPVPVYRALTMLATPEPQSQPVAPLVGRDDQIAQLRELAEQALVPAGQAGHVVAIVGEPGIGKTRLIDALWQHLTTASPAVQLLRGACQSYEQARPYALIVRLLAQLLRGESADDRITQAERFQKQLDDRVPEWSRFAPLLGSLLGLTTPETSLTSALTAEQRRDRLHDLIVALLLAGTTPLALAVDNLQWIDPSSEAILQRLMLEISDHPILLLLLARPDAEQQQPWRDLAYSTTLNLGPLDAGSSTAFLAALLDTNTLPDLGPLIQRSQGVPFFLEQTVRYLIDTRILQRGTDGMWLALRLIDESTIPVEIEQMLVARLDQLAHGTRAVIQAASVIGPQFDPRLLPAVTSPDALPNELVELQHHGFLGYDEDQAVSTYTFQNTLTRDVIYNMIAYAQRRVLHAQLATTMEQVYEDELAAWGGVIGQHFVYAEQPDQALPHFMRAAQQAQARYANQEAIALYTQALYAAPWYGHDDVRPDLSLAAPLYEGLGDVLALTGSYGSAREQYGALIEMIDMHAPQTMYVLKAALQRKVGSTLENQGNFDTAIERLNRALATIQQASPDDSTFEYARILSDIGWVYFRQNDLAQAQLYLEQALSQLEEEEITVETARIYNRLGGIAWQQGDLAKAQRYVEQSLAASEKAGDLVGQASALNNLGTLTGVQGQYVKSVDYSLEAIKINEYIQNQREIAITALNTGWSFYELNDYDNAQAYLEMSVYYSKSVRDLYHQMLALSNLGEILMIKELYDSAEAMMSESQIIAFQLNNAGQKVENYIRLSNLALQQQNSADAKRFYYSAAEIPIDTNSEEFAKLQQLKSRIEI